MVLEECFEEFAELFDVHSSRVAYASLKEVAQLDPISCDQGSHRAHAWPFASRQPSGMASSAQKSKEHFEHKPILMNSDEFLFRV